eukprot:3426852-Rhodomonas_salina.1
MATRLRASAAVCPAPNSPTPSCKPAGQLRYHAYPLQLACPLQSAYCNLVVCLPVRYRPTRSRPTRSLRVWCVLTYGMLLAESRWSGRYGPWRATLPGTNSAILLRDTSLRTFLRDTSLRATSLRASPD